MLPTLTIHVGGVKRYSRFLLKIRKVFLFCGTFVGLIVIKMHR